MKNKPIIVINGEPNSVFLEIFFKSIKYKKLLKSLPSKKLLFLNFENFFFGKMKIKFFFTLLPPPQEIVYENCIYTFCIIITL